VGVYTLLVAVDGSEHAEGAVRHAIDMTRRMPETRIVLVNVQPPAMSGEVSNLLTAEEVMAQHTEAGHKVLARAKALLEAAHVPYDAEIVIGTPADGIVECATRHGCDIIVVGASSHGRVHSLVLGSVASKIVRHADLPVTIVK
jgi:nucleotide-binding universal stress UspA family protein